MEDNLRSLRFNFYVGNFEKVIEDTKGSSSNDEITWYLRALLETDPKKLLKTVTDSSPTVPIARSRGVGIQTMHCTHTLTLIAPTRPTRL